MRFRKKPVVIDAVRLDEKLRPADLHAFLGDFTQLQPVLDGTRAIVIRTLEGDMRANEGDWIVKGVKGEFYPVKPDIFAATYEAADAQRDEPTREPGDAASELYERRPEIAFVLAEMKHRALEGCAGEHDGTCCDPEMNIHPEDWCNPCLMGTIAQVNEDLQVDAATIRRQALDEAIALAPKVEAVDSTCSDFTAAVGIYVEELEALRDQPGARETE